jgi:hypothetical protein
VRDGRAATSPPAQAAAEAPSAWSPTQARAAVEKIEVEKKRRDLLARRGDQIAIDLEGSGWIYLGAQPGGSLRSTARQGIEFLSRRDSAGKTSFSFKASEYGEYELSFQFQDNQRALLRNQVIHLQVLPEQDFEAALEEQRQMWPEQPDGAIAEPETAPEPVPGPPIEQADILFDLGEYELALIEYKRHMRAGDPYLNDRLGACYAATGEHLAAVKYYRENLGLEGAYGDRAAVGLVRTAVALEDSRLLLEALPSLFGLHSMPIGSELLEIARFQTEARSFATAVEALEQYLERYPDGTLRDEAYYRLARIYEGDSPYRDLESAREYYELLYESFPESVYADRAEERLNYLDRHFFLVQ